MKKNKIYTILSIFTFAFLFLIVFFVWPLLKEIQKNSENLVSAKNSIVALNAQAKETENFKNNYESYKPNLEKIDHLFVDQANPVEFIEFLENTAASSGITSQISLPSSSQNSEQAGQGSVIFQFSSTGSFAGVIGFTKKIETGPYLIEIENLTIQNSQEESVAKDYFFRKVDAKFTIKVFTKK